MYQEHPGLGDTPASEKIYEMSVNHNPSLTSAPASLKSDAHPDFDDVREWARDVVGLSPAMDRRKLAVGLLTRLAETEFAPPDDWYEAIDAISAPEGTALNTVPLDYYYTRESGLRLEVRDFVRTFFELPVSDRRARWSRLSQLCQPWPLFRTWLADMERGLDVELKFPAGTAYGVLQLGHIVAQRFLYAKGPVNRNVNEQLGSFRRDARIAKSAARVLSRKYPHIAQLDAKLVTELAWPTPFSLSSLISRFRKAKSAPAEPADTEFPVSGAAVAIIGFILFRVFLAASDTRESWSPEPVRVPPAIRFALDRDGTIREVPGTDKDGGKKIVSFSDFLAEAARRKAADSSARQGAQRESLPESDVSRPPPPPLPESDEDAPLDVVPLPEAEAPKL